METFLCTNVCCEIKIKPYKENDDSNKKFIENKKKAGVFIYDPKTNKILIVQSRGNLWGSPKGTIEYGESEVQCAIREVIEETGITLTEKNLSRSFIVCNVATYFYIEMNECFVEINGPQNDATGISWINPECLKKCIELGNISITHHFRILLGKLFGLIFQDFTFMLVGSKKRSQKFIIEQD